MNPTETWRRERLLRRTRRALRPPLEGSYAHLGRHALVLPPARVESPDCISLGDGVIIHEHAWLCVQRREGLPTPRLVVGDRTSINRFVKIVVHGSVTVGSDVLFADRCYVSDVEHRPSASGLPEVTEPRPVVIEDGVFLGLSAVIKPGVTLGRGCYVGANSVVTQDVAPYTLVVGAPARAVRRGGPDGAPWQRIRAD